MAKNYNWTCRFCGRPQVGTEANTDDRFHNIDIGNNRYGNLGVGFHAVACQNPECQNVTFGVRLAERNYIQSMAFWREGTTVHSWWLLPESTAKPQPDFIPEVLRADYFEACRIRELSPKASATLARRCLQGMIRDFCGIKRNRLIDEINNLRKALDEGKAPAGVNAETVEAIDHVRSIGNIGAHMEKDVDLIIEIDPDEAQVLIELIEMLFSEWYVERHSRQQKLARIAEIRAKKDAMKNGNTG